MTYRFQWYQEIYERIPDIHKEAEDIGRDMGLERLGGRIGLYPGSSSCAGPLAPWALEAIVEVNQGRLTPMRVLTDRLREVVKDVYGDEYDAAAANTCESALRVTFETLFAPPTLRRGETYRARFITPYNEDVGFMVGYGRAFPPKYKNLVIDRTVSGGELGVEGKALANLDAVLVRFAGAQYQAHGIRYNPVPLLSRVDPDATAATLEQSALEHIHELAGFAGLGYDTAGYGYGAKAEGVPVLKRAIGNLAARLDRPYVVDAASCCPFIGLGPDEIGADVMMWSMDKACRAPVSGLLIGKEEAMVPIRKGMGLGGGRHGEVSSHGKAAYSFSDPGRDSVAGLIAVLEVLRDQPELATAAVDRMHAIIEEEFAKLEPAWLREGLLIQKSYTMGGTEINYERTWEEREFGIPLFSGEDLFANTNPIMTAMDHMGVSPATIYAGNIFLAPGDGTLDPTGALLEDETRLAVRALVRATEIVCRHAGLEHASAPPPSPPESEIVQ